MDPLATFLADRRGRNLPWNCSTMPADWIVSLGKPDFAAHWRTTLDPVACEAAAPDAEDLIGLWVRDIGDGLSRTTAPVRGDIGVIEIAGLFAGAICCGEQWVIEGPRTMHFIGGEGLRVLAAWHG